MYARETQTIRMKLGECVRQTETLTPFFFALAKRTRRDDDDVGAPDTYMSGLFRYVGRNVE